MYSHHVLSSFPTPLPRPSPPLPTQLHLNLNFKYRWLWPYERQGHSLRLWRGLNRGLVSFWFPGFVWLFSYFSVVPFNPEWSILWTASMDKMLQNNWLLGVRLLSTPLCLQVTKVECHMNRKLEDGVPRGVWSEVWYRWMPCLPI